MQVVLCIACPLSNNTKLKFGQDFKAYWSFCLELKVLNRVKVLNALGPLCLWQCLSLNIMFTFTLYMCGNTLFSKPHDLAEKLCCKFPLQILGMWYLLLICQTFIKKKGWNYIFCLDKFLLKTHDIKSW